MPPGRQQIVLAALALSINRVVSTDHLIETVWGGDPPDTARTQIQICLSRLRRLLEPTGARVVTQSPGYRLDAPADGIDVRRFETQVRTAERLIMEGQDAEAADLLRAADAWWRGPALAGIDSDALRGTATRLEEERISAVETRLRIELALGRHDRLVPEITALVQAHPLREALQARLMIALYRSGRQTEALEVYRTARRRLADDLGLEPGPELRAAEQAVLTGSAALTGTPDDQHITGAAVPGAVTEPAPADQGEDRTPGPADRGGSGPTAFQLPTATADFVGREETIAATRGALLDRVDSVGVAVLLGRPGVGKSATAVEVAHQLADTHFPDGQLYCDLRATQQAPVAPAEVLRRFLRALGVPNPVVPVDEDERAAMFRGLLADRRVLIVLDDAATESQVLPLLPGSAGCGVLVTSRARLTGLPGSSCIELDVLTVPTALRLLAQTLGRDRVDNEPEAALALAHATGRLPLALRIVAARLNARTHWPLAGLVNRLADERRRLDELSHGDLTLRAGMALAYDGFDPTAARTFALLGLLEGPTIPAWAAAALVDDDRPFPSDLTEPLVDVHLLDVVGVDAAGETVHRFQELVRVFAREKLAELTTDADRRAAVERFCGGWLTLLAEANRRLLGGDHLQIAGPARRWDPPARFVEQLLADPVAWLESERNALRPVVEIAVRYGLVDHCWELVVRSAILLERRGYLSDLADLHDLAAPVVQDAGNRLGMAALVEVANSGLRDRYDTGTRRRQLTAALRDLEELGHREGQALVRRELAHLMFGELTTADATGASAAERMADERAAFELCAQALADFAAEGDRAGQWRTLMLQGRERVRRGDHDGGRADLRRALELADGTGDRRAIAQVLRAVGLAELADGLADSAADRLTAALDHVVALRDPLGEAIILQELGVVRVRQGRSADAVPLWRRSRDRFGEVRQDSARARVEAQLAALAPATD
ncbi:AfsR/SARP family transcriptional regulator [Nakamurella flava]|uniref:AfsR/SARP family transcriptional regulator n=1 Tax=Nakamurella flava TaxID=2576308 RepID=UPI00197C58AA|nr:AfsR/SARP family transcriptional regulator [Nakamurella flava]